MRPLSPKFGVVAGSILLAAMWTGSACRRPRGTAVEGYAFVACAGSSAVAVVDLASFSVARQIPVDAPPVQLVSDAARRAVYVMGEGGSAGLTVIDAAKLEKTRSLWLADKPQRIRLAPGGERLYILDGRAQLFKSFDLERMAHGRQLRLPAAPVDMAISPDGRRACVSLASGDVAVVDLARWTITATVRLGGQPAAIAVRHDSRQAFVANQSERLISVVDLVAGKLIAHLPLNTRPEAMRFKPDGGELFVSGGDSSAVLILSAYRDEVDQPLLAGAEPRDIAITKDNHLLFVANSAANTVTVINIDDRRTLAAVPVGDEPHRVALTPDDQYALVLNRKSGDMAVIRVVAVGPGRNIQPLFTMIRVGSRPVDLAVQPK